MLESEIKLGTDVFVWPTVQGDLTASEPTQKTLGSAVIRYGKKIACMLGGSEFPLEDVFPTRQAAFEGRSKQLATLAQAAINHAESLRAKALPIPAVPHSLADLIPLRAAA